MAEKEYIEREEALARKYFSLAKTPDENRRFEAEIKYYLSILPAAADVVEVVRCKDCKHYDDEFNLCILRSEAPDPNPNSDFCGCEFTTHINDFCSWGKRKENYNG